MNWLIKLRILVYRAYFNSIGLLNKNASADQLIHLFSTPRSRVIRNKEVEILETAQSEHIVHKGEKIKLYAWGEGEKYILLCHGWESNAGSLGAYVEPLLSRGYKIISYDGPAHGASQGKKANLIAFKEIAEKIIAEIGLPHAAIGHSLGANVIIMLAYQQKIKIPKVVLISPFNQLRAIYLGFKDILKIPESIYGIMLDKSSERFNVDVRNLEFGKLGDDSELENILILHDKDDKITPFSHSATMDKRWEKAVLETIEGSGHYKILWNEQAIDRALKFI